MLFEAVLDIREALVYGVGDTVLAFRKRQLPQRGKDGAILQYCHVLPISGGWAGDGDYTLPPMMVLCAVLYTEIRKCLRRLYWA
jgi:hypothetical protein